MTAAKRQPAVFLDRDGTLIRDVGYLTRPEQIELLDGVPAAIRALREAGFRTVVVTNQSAVANNPHSTSFRSLALTRPCQSKQFINNVNADPQEEVCISVEKGLYFLFEIKRRRRQL